VTVTAAPADAVLYEAIKSPAAYVAAYNSLMDEPSNRLRIRAVTDLLHRIGPGVERVIDVACGGGAYTASARAVLGGAVRFCPVDRQTACAAGYRMNHPDAIPALADVTALPFRPGTFDVALCLDIVEHLHDDVEFLRGIHRVLVPGGWVVVSTHNSRSLEHVLGLARATMTGTPWRGWDPTHIRFYNAGSLRRLLREAGFDVVALDGTYYWPFHLPARVASWPLQRMGLSSLARAVYRAVAAPGYMINAALEACSPLPGLRTAGWGIMALARKRSS
jgi:2-polyprenyl-3-methyl-5-hydroxy-6-metoxy-1,4-benzoquinol methylase